VSERAERLAGLAEGEGLDALLISATANVRWACGFTGSSGIALVGPRLRVFVTDFRYVEQAAEQVPGFDRLRAQSELFDALPGALPEGELRLGFDDADLSVARHAALGERLPERVELVPCGGLVERLRAVKDAAEVKRIRAAAALADEALEAVLHDGLAARSERDVALALEIEMRERGAQSASFEPIVAAGPHGALPHAEPRAIEIPAGALVVVDWGARLDGYCSDCTRTLATGEVGEEAAEVHALVDRAREAALAELRAGRTGREMDAVAREMIDAAGYGERFGHGLGHGVGLEVHEGPRLGRTADAVLEAGNVVTIEPGVYLPGRFGVRIEDLALVGEDGADVLTGLGRALRIV